MVGFNPQVVVEGAASPAPRAITGTGTGLLGCDLSGSPGTLGIMPNVVLEAFGVKSYADLYEMDTADALRRVDERNVPLHPGDAGLAVLVLRGVSDLERATKRLDDTRRGLQVFGFILAVISTAAAVTSVVQAF